MYNNIYETAQEAFEDLYDVINSRKTHANGTRKIYDVGIKIMNPLKNEIKSDFRAWNKTYADREWAWYMSENRSVKNLKKYAPIWDKMHNGDDLVNSNYGYQWNRNNQLQAKIEQLKNEPSTRQAWVTILDSKEHDIHGWDTPCTLSIGFVIEDDLLCMRVLMRSNDLWFGFCNDQYCFSKLQQYVARQLNLNCGYYYHYATDMHLYKQHFDEK